MYFKIRVEGSSGEVNETLSPKSCLS